MLGPNSKPRSWGSRVLVLPDVLGSESCSSPRIIPRCTVGVSFPGLFTEWWCGDEGPHSLFSFSNFPGSGCPFWSVRDWGWAHRQGVSAMSPLRSLLEQQARRPQQARLPTGGKPDTLCQGHSEFNVPGLAVSTGPLSVCLSLCSFHGCLFCFMAAHVLFYRLW